MFKTDSGSIILAKVNDSVNSVNFTFCHSLFNFKCKNDQEKRTSNANSFLGHLSH